LEYLSSQFKDGDVILLDEISWMGDKDPTFIPKLKEWWDKQFSPENIVDDNIKQLAFVSR